MAQSSPVSSLLTLGAVGIGGYFLYEWLTTPALPADAQYILQWPSTTPAGTISAGLTPVGVQGPLNEPNTSALTVSPGQYVWYSPSQKQYYANSTAPTSAQIAASPVQAALNAPVPSTTVTTDGAPVVTPPATVEPPPAQPQPSLASVYSNMIAQASSDPNFTGAGDSLTSSGYRWNVYLGLALPSADAIPQPTGFDLSQNMTATQYWAVMGPALTQAYGLAGFMAGLGAYRASMRGLGDDTVTDDLTGIVYDMSGNIVSQPGVPYTSGGVTITPTAPGSVTTANCPGPGCPTGSAASSLGGISSTTWLMVGAGGLLLLAAFGSKR